MNEKQNALMAVAVGGVVLALSAGGFFLALDSKKTAGQSADQIAQLQQQVTALEQKAREADVKFNDVVGLLESLANRTQEPAAGVKKAEAPSQPATAPTKPRSAPQDYPQVGPAAAPTPSSAYAPAESGAAKESKTRALDELLGDMPVDAEKVDSLLVERISNNWHRPDSAKNGMQVTIEIGMNRKGKIQRVKVLKSSGDEAFDNSAVKAIQDVKVIPEVAALPTDTYTNMYKSRRVIFTPESLGK